MDLVTIQEIIDNPTLLEVARKKVEDVLINFRDSRISQLNRHNGLVVYEKDASQSSIIRLGTEDAIRIGLTAIKEHLESSLQGISKKEE